MMKKMFSCMAALLLIILALPASAQAAGLPIDEAVVYYNGERQEIKAWLKDGAALLPLRRLYREIGRQAGDP